MSIDRYYLYPRRLLRRLPQPSLPPMLTFTYVWPYMGAGAALLLALLLMTDLLRSDRSVSRWQDLV